MTEYKQVPQPPPHFDVTIRNHTVPEAQWENFSDISSASGMTLTPKMERVPLSLPPQKYIGKLLYCSWLSGPTRVFLGFLYISERSTNFDQFKFFTFRSFNKFRSLSFSLFRTKFFIRPYHNDNDTCNISKTYFFITQVKAAQTCSPPSWSNRPANHTSRLRPPTFPYCRNCLQLATHCSGTRMMKMFQNLPQHHQCHRTGAFWLEYWRPKLKMK